MDGGVEDAGTYVSLCHGKEPLVYTAPTKHREQQIALKVVQGWLETGIAPESICIVARFKKQLELLKAYFSQNRIDTYELKNSNKDELGIGGIRMTTMHRVKGLEFDCILVFDASEDVIPLKSLIKSAADAVQQKEYEETERRLLYVATTRARKELTLTACGEASALLPEDNIRRE